SSVISSWDGDLAFRGLASHIDTLKQVNLDGSVWEGAGVQADRAGIGADGPTAPSWKYLLSATYALDSFSATLTARGIGSGLYNHKFIHCTASCPPSTSENPTLGISNYIASETYFDLSLSYDILGEGGELFF